MKHQAISVDVLREKYAQTGEDDIGAVQRRVARALAAWETAPADWRRRFLEAQQAGFIPAGRINAAVGTPLTATLINCFVQPIGDSISADADGCPGIYPALEQAAETLRRSGGVGYDFSAIRPKGAVVGGTGSRASGPVSFMRVFDRSAETLESAGARRGAQMGMLRADHPDIARFVHAKDEPGELTNFNISVAAGDDFMQAVAEDAVLELVHPAEPGAEAKTGESYLRADGLWVWDRIPARRLFDEITERSYRYGDPGMVFTDTVNRENNLQGIEHIRATNPCAEQPLPAYGCCCLGSIDLTRFVRDPFSSGALFAHQELDALVPHAVRMLDNVLDVTVWPLKEQMREGRAKRRIGLGFTGLGDCLIMLGLRYASDQAREFAASIARRMRDAAYRASAALAREKGAFPLFSAEQYASSPFFQRLPGDLRDEIGRHGLRNSHLLSIAPTGTISLAFADNVSNGIEPAYAWAYERRRRLATGETRRYQVEDHAFRLYRVLFGQETRLPEAFQSALHIDVHEHLAMVAAVSPYIDSSISKTVNVPADYSFSDFRNLYLDAWHLGLKALSTFRPSTERESILSIGGRFEEDDDTPGTRCPQCGAPGFRKVDGCRFCDACGFDEDCG